MITLTLEFKNQAELIAHLTGSSAGHPPATPALTPAQKGKATREKNRALKAKAEAVEAPTQPTFEFPVVEAPVVHPPVFEQPAVDPPVLEQPVTPSFSFDRGAILGEITVTVQRLLATPEANSHAAAVLNLVKEHATAGGYAANKAGELQDAQLPAFLRSLQTYEVGQQPQPLQEY